MATTDPEGNDDDDDNRGITSTLTVDDMLIMGLSLGGYTKQQIERVNGEAQSTRISTHLRILQLPDCTVIERNLVF